MDGAKTVGDLMARIRAVTGVEIYADRRYVELDVYFRSGANVLIRAGDLLKTLALSVTGTCRRVASGADAAFVLTDDRVGCGIRLTLIGDWIENATARLREEQQKLSDGAREADVTEKAQWVP